LFFVMMFNLGFFSVSVDNWWQVLFSIFCFQYNLISIFLNNQEFKFLKPIFFRKKKKNDRFWSMEGRYNCCYAPSASVRTNKGDVHKSHAGIWKLQKDGRKLHISPTDHEIFCLSVHHVQWFSSNYQIVFFIKSPDIEPEKE